MRYKRFSGSRANGKGRTNKLARASAVRLQTRWVTEPDKQTKIETAGTSGVRVVNPSKHEREKEIRFYRLHFASEIVYNQRLRRFVTCVGSNISIRIRYFTPGISIPFVIENVFFP